MVSTIRGALGGIGAGGGAGEVSGKVEEVTSELRLDDANHFTSHLFLPFPGAAGVEVNQKNGLGGILGRRNPGQGSEGRMNTGSERRLISLE